MIKVNLNKSLCHKCQHPFIKGQFNQRFCSPKCKSYYFHNLNPVIRNCVICGSQFRDVTGKTKTCIGECRVIYRRNRKRVNQRNRKSRIKEAGGTFSLAEWNLVTWIFDDHCAYCWEKKKLSIDHVIPISKGGNSYIENIVPACLPCNQQKQAKLIEGIF